MLSLNGTAKKTIAAVARKYRLEVVVLFGSRARRRASPMSDTDVAVWSASELSMTRHLKLGRELEKALPIAQHIGAERGAAVPESYAAAIEQLGAIGVLPKKFAAEFAEVARLRNVVVHAYAKLDIDILVRHTPKLIKDSRQFLRCVLKKM